MGRNTYREIYESAKLSSFTDRELNFIQNPPGGKASVVGNNPIDEVLRDNTSFTTVNKDADGNITGYTFVGLPGLDGQGNPTQETTDYLIQNGTRKGVRGTTRENWEVKLPNGQTILLRPQEMGAIIRQRHGIAEAGAAPDRDTQAGRPSYHPASFTTRDMRKYVEAHQAARSLVEKANELAEKKQNLIDNKILIRVEEGVLNYKGEQEGTSEQWIYRNEYRDPTTGKLLEGEAFDDKTPIIDLMDKFGIGPNSEDFDASFAQLVSLEFDQLCSGYLTRDHNGESRIDINGNVIGGPTLSIMQLFPPTGRDEGGGILYTVKTGVGGIKYGMQGAVAGGLVGGFIDSFLRQKIPGYGTGTIGAPFSLVATKLHHLEQTISGHHGPSHGMWNNKLIWIKALYGGIAMVKGQATPYTNIAVPFAINAAIHKFSPYIARFLFSFIRGAELAALTGGVSAVLELVWIGSEWGYNLYIKPKLEEERERKAEKERVIRLTVEAIEKGCLIARYVQSNGTRCIKCKAVTRLNPRTGKMETITPTQLEDDSQLPIGIESIKQDVKTGVILEIIYKYPPPKPKPVEQQPPGRGSVRAPDPDSPLNRDGAYLYDSGRGSTNPLGQQTFTYTTVNPSNGESETIGYVVSTHNASKEAEYLGIITANYVAAKNTAYVSELLNVTTLSNDPNLFQNQSANAGPIYNAASPADQITNNRNPFGDNPYAEIEASKQRDRELQEKDKYWLGLLYSGGSSRGGDGNGGGGTLPPHENATLDSSAMPIAGLPNAFMLDMGYDILYYYGGYATLIPKVDRPTIQYSSDGMG